MPKRCTAVEVRCLRERVGFPGIDGLRDQFGGRSGLMSKVLDEKDQISTSFIIMPHLGILCSSLTDIRLFYRPKGSRCL